MQFSFTEDQRLFADTVRDLLADQCPPSRVRAAWEGTTDRALWSQLGEMGVLALMAPESAGGMGMSELDLVLLLVETGRCAMPDPVVDTAAVAVPMLAEAEHAALASVAGGELAVAVGFEDDPIVRIDADRLLLQRDGAWHLVPVDAVAATPETSVDGARRMATIQWSPGPDTLITDDPAAGERAFERAILGSSAAARGSGRPPVGGHRRVCPGARAVRSAHRQLPGAEAQARRRAPGAGFRPADGGPLPPTRWPTATRRPASTCPWPRPTPRRPG